MSNYKTVLVGVDGSENGRQALHKAARVAEDNGAKLVIAKVLDVRSFQSHETLHADFISEVRARALKELESEVEFVKMTYPKVEVEFKLSYGAPSTEMSEHLPEEFDADLVVVGSTGRGATEHLLFGSVAERVSRNAPVEVLIVRGK